MTSENFRRHVEISFLTIAVLSAMSSAGEIRDSVAGEDLYHDDRLEEEESPILQPTPEQGAEANELGGFSLESFREELDNITKSLDDEIDFDQLLQEARRMSRSHEDEQRSPAHSVEDDYEQSMSPFAATPEPTPVKTPKYHPFDYDEDGEVLSTVVEDDGGVSDEDLALIDRLDRQAVQIRRLERENRNLRKEVRHLRESQQRSNVLTSPGAAFVDELRHVVDLPGDQRANLSRIMDVYFDQEQSQRKVRRSRFY